jgi:hypothetical protein
MVLSRVLTAGAYAFSGGKICATICSEPIEPRVMVYTVAQGCGDQEVRSTSEARQGWQIDGPPVTPECAPEFVKAEAAIMSFPR